MPSKRSPGNCCMRNCTPEIVRIDGLMERGEYLIAEEHLQKLPDDPRALVRYAEETVERSTLMPC